MFNNIQPPETPGSANTPDFVDAIYMTINLGCIIDTAWWVFCIASKVF